IPSSARTRPRRWRSTTATKGNSCGSISSHATGPSTARSPPYSSSAGPGEASRLPLRCPTAPIGGGAEPVPDSEARQGDQNLQNEAPTAAPESGGAPQNSQNEATTAAPGSGRVPRNSQNEAITAVRAWMFIRRLLAPTSGIRSGSWPRSDQPGPPRPAPQP